MPVRRCLVLKKEYFAVLVVQVESVLNDFVRLKEAVSLYDDDEEGGEGGAGGGGLEYLLDGDDENYQLGERCCGSGLGALEGTLAAWPVPCGRGWQHGAQVRPRRRRAH